jgi:uncharacterized protein
MPPSPRNIEVDTIRTFALIGICIVNIPFLGLTVTQHLVPPTAFADQAAVFAVEALFQGKFFLMFSFIFGWGMHIQDQAAARSNVSFGQRYARRLAGLALLGALHATLVFTGDILVLYAVLGALIWRQRNKTPSELVMFAARMVPLAAVAMGIIALALSAPMPIPSGPGLGGSFAEGVATRIAEWPLTFLFVALFNGPLALGAFAMGIAAAKVDFFAPGNPLFARLSRAVPVLLAVGVPLNLLYAAAMSGLLPDPAGIAQALGMMSLSLGAPMLAAVYLVGIIHFARRALPGPGLLASGRNSLSGYVLQGVVAGAVFGGYGLGLYGQLEQAELLILSLAIAAVGLLLAFVWTRIFQRGPLEVVLRRITTAN